MNKIQKIILGSVIILAVPVAVHASTLVLTPSSGSHKTGETFNVDVVLDTKGADIDGVDLYSLRYDKALLQVVDANTTVSGVQIVPGSLFPVTAANTVDNSAGTIVFSQLTTGGSHYKGSGTLATITFKVLTTGTATVKFDFTAGKTNDTNVAGDGVDTLTAVTNGSYTLAKGDGTVPSPTPTPPPAPTPAPTPSPTPTAVPITSTGDETPTPTPVPTPTPLVVGSIAETFDTADNTRLYIFLVIFAVLFPLLVYVIYLAVKAGPTKPIDPLSTPPINPQNGPLQ